MVILYFHIPFCKKKCDYCNFYSILNEESQVSIFMEALELEWNKRKKNISDNEITSLYFGGGTPSVLGPKKISKIISWVKKENLSQSAEITVEVNPEDVSLSLMQEYTKAGVNRVSIGCQSFDDDLLKKISRTHTPFQAKQAVLDSHRAGIINISIDLMYDIPTQTEKSWQDTLNLACSLPITHIALYNLTIESKQENNICLYGAALKTFAENNFEQYEISAFQKPGFYSRHNCAYWTNIAFLGFGPSASSYWEGKRFKNVSNLGKYCQALNSKLSPVDFVEELPQKDKIREQLAVNLRLLEGANLDNFKDLDSDTVKAIDRLKTLGLLTQKTKRLKMTKKGILFYDTIASELI